jgi:hypothetical protein
MSKIFKISNMKSQHQGYDIAITGRNGHRVVEMTLQSNPVEFNRFDESHFGADKNDSTQDLADLAREWMDEQEEIKEQEQVGLTNI